jgi:hypothetical protein
MPGVRAELELVDPPDCPIATLSEGGPEVTDVRWTDAGDDVVHEQFRTDGSADVGGDVDGEAIDPLFADGERTVYGLERENADCACAAVESTGVPVESVRARDGSLLLTVHLPGVDRLQEVVAAVRERTEVRVRRLSHGGDDTAADPSDLVPVDRNVLTDRQREVLETAHRMGYFEHPRESNATEVAEALDVCPSTLIEHLTTAQGKLFDELLARRRGDAVESATSG